MRIVSIALLLSIIQFVAPLFLVHPSINNTVLGEASCSDNRDVPNIPILSITQENTFNASVSDLAGKHDDAQKNPFQESVDATVPTKEPGSVDGAAPLDTLSGKRPVSIETIPLETIVVPIMDKTILKGTLILNFTLSASSPQAARRVQAVLPKIINLSIATLYHEGPMLSDQPLILKQQIETILLKAIQDFSTDVHGIIIESCVIHPGS